MDLIAKLTTNEVKTKVDGIVELIKRASAMGKARVTVSMLHYNVVDELKKLGYEVTEEKDEDYEIKVPYTAERIALRDTC